VPSEGKSHRMALPSKTRNDDYPNRLAWEFISKAKKANTPSDASDIITLEIEQERLQLKDMRDFTMLWSESWTCMKSQRPFARCACWLLTRAKMSCMHYSYLKCSNEAALILIGCVMTCPRSRDSLKVGIKGTVMRNRFISHL
jgi:hypothetical protein